MLHISTHTELDAYSTLGPEGNLLGMWDSVAHILSSIPAGLSDLTLDFSVHAESRDFFRQAVHWEDIDVSLSSLLSLRSMVVNIRVVETEFDDDYEVYTDMINYSFHRMAKSGIMRLHVTIVNRVPHDWSVPYISGIETAANLYLFWMALGIEDCNEDVYIQ